MSSSEDRPLGRGDAFDEPRAEPADNPSPPDPADAPTQVGLPVAPPPPTADTTPAMSRPPADAPGPAAPTPPPGYGGYRPPEAPPAGAGGPSPMLIGILAVLLVAALAVVMVFAFDLLSPRTPPAATAVGAATPASPQTTEPAGPATTSPAATADDGSPAPGSPSPAEATPTAPPADPQQRLLAHVPPHLRSTCQLSPGTAPALAIASCQADEGKILATYFLYANEQDMEAAYDGFVETSGIEPDSGRCSDPDTWPSEGSYSVSEQPAGRVLCMQISDAPTVYWTDSRLLILTWAFHFEANPERLYEFWRNEAGPAS